RYAIAQVTDTILTKKYATQAELDVINKRVAETVAAAVKFAEESPVPNVDEVYKDIYIDKNYPFIKD
ncbi:MAG TPA: pyruvate dehydrogenase (acetyl-transferring) E1 component subunit alpha, partial [Puia sp.]|nr:pyruvate dehydrogenase (acetyl-transferring) E1 component subunit alpha [Puia sp.]